MKRNKTGSRLLTVLLAALMLLAYAPILGVTAFADTNDGVIAD